MLGIKAYKDPYYQGFAAQLAFYFLLSIFPAVIVISQLLGLFSISLHAIGAWIERYVSAEIAEMLGTFFVSAPTGTMNIVMVLTVFWAASRAQFSMMRIVNYTMTGGRMTGKGYFRDRLKALVTIVFTLFTVVFALVVLVYGEILLWQILENLSPASHIGEMVDLILRSARWPFALALFFLMAGCSYYVLPYEKVKFKSILPGSLFASVALLVVTLVYSRYAQYAANYDIIYGSLASVVVLLFWFYFLSWALWLGALFNKVWADTK